MADSLGWYQETTQRLSDIALASRSQTDVHSGDQSTIAVSSTDNHITEGPAGHGLGVHYDRAAQPSPGSSFVKPPTATYHVDYPLHPYRSQSRIDTEDSDVESTAGSESDRQGRLRPQVQGSRYFGTHYDLRPLLVRRHILMISLSGTIGIGVLVTCGQILKLAGSAGALLAYVLTGMLVYCVMGCIGELVSLIPEAGAIMEYPMRFVDDALGWTVAIAYWFTYAMGLPTLTTSTAILVSYWKNDVGVGAIITIIILVVVAINVFGIKVFGEIEYASGMLKVLLVTGLIILMLAINRGAGSPGFRKVYGMEYWTQEYRFSENFAGIESLTGSTGRFLSVWKGMTLAAFSYIGVEIIAVTASEAKYPRDDLPRASRRIFWTTFTLYIAAIFFVSINVPYKSENLKDLYDSRPTTAELSPFIIAVKNAGISFLPGFINAAMLFASWSTTNTELFVASRTLYGMAARLDEQDHPWLTVFKRTTKNGVPMTAIFASCIFAPLAYLQCGGSRPQKLLDVFSQMETVACLFVWGCQCWAFIRFYHGLQVQRPAYRRGTDDYPYTSRFQPWAAYFGLIGCILLLIFNGFDLFLFKGFKKAFSWSDFLAAYLAIIVIAIIYMILKLVRRSHYVRVGQMVYTVRRENFNRRRVEPNRGRIGRVLGWIFE